MKKENIWASRKITQGQAYFDMNWLSGKVPIGKLIDKQNIAFIGSIDTEGFPNMKAMLKPIKREGLRMFYFTTNTSSMRVTQYLKDNHSCIYFCDGYLFKGVMLKGTIFDYYVFYRRSTDLW